MTSKITKQTEAVKLTSNTLAAAYKRAESLGMSLSEYVQSLITKDAQTEAKNPWFKPIPQHVEKRWEQDIAAFEAEDEQGLQPTFNTVEELVHDLES